ncbi:MAG: HAMP domain-containing histidine kinase [Mogibacterium sp.]|nr:HAMP domain-containing histidine kinase [Mogibacterium sp.]
MKKKLFRNKGLYVLLSVLTAVSGAAAGILCAITLGVARMADASQYSEKEIENLIPWTAEFSGAHAQADFISKGITEIILLAAASLISLAVLCVMSGRFRMDENDKPVLNRFDRIWSEIHLIVLACAASGAVALGLPPAALLSRDNHFGLINLSGIYEPVPMLADEYYMGIPNNTVFWYCALGMAASIWISAVCLLSLVKKIKAGELISSSLLGKILKLLGWGARHTGEGAKMAGARIRSAAGSVRRFTIPADNDPNAVIKLAVKYCLILLSLMVLPEFLGMFFGSGFIAVIAEMLAVLAAITLVIRKTGRLASLRAGIAEVRSGNLSYKITVDEDENGPRTVIDKMASDMNHISEAANIAVQNEIRNQRLKTDLISNVSHDLKTPLTSMISYLDILEREGLDSEDAPAHLAIVREKTERLKILTEELIEAAKASSGNIPCEIEKIDLSALIDQSLAEMCDRLSSKNLDIRKKNTADNTLVMADGKLLYRVLENLLGNISKYALEGSRVYIDVSKPQQMPVIDPDASGRLLLEVKNISRDELNISADELMERFTRGDKSRNTEGSGLGLAIAKDLTTLMGGSFDISIDGDMFKTSILLREAC